MPVNPCVTKGCGRYELEAENARLREELAESIMANKRTQDAYLSNTTQLAAAQEDAARYRWLRENLDNTEALEELYEYPGDIPTAEEFDAAIDAAMKEGEQA